jgi:uncharacterized RmlC-like cupin family protein
MVHFLVSGENSSGSIAELELTVAGGARLMAPAHNHNHYEETIYGVDGALTILGCCKVLGHEQSCKSEKRIIAYVRSD